MGSMYRWFEAYQDKHFPDPMGLRAMAHKWSLGLYPGVIKAAMAVYDIPEAIAVVRSTVCAAPSAAAGFASLTRLQVRRRGLRSGGRQPMLRSALLFWG